MLLSLLLQNDRNLCIIQGAQIYCANPLNTKNLLASVALGKTLLLKRIRRIAKYPKPITQLHL